jgi:hypothetical protein
VNGTRTGRTGGVLYSARQPGDPADYRRLIYMRFDHLNTDNQRDLNYPGGILRR